MKKIRKSLLDKMLEKESFKKKYDEEKQVFEIEYQLAKIMEDHNVSQKDLAEKLGVDKSVISKDFSGALRKAGVKKLQAIAEALDCEFMPLFVPREKKSKLEKSFRNLLFNSAKRA